jgi:hypothetical protein
MPWNGARSFFPLVAEQPAEFIAFGSLGGLYSPAQFRRWTLPFFQRYVSRLHERGKICALHAHNSSLQVYADQIRGDRRGRGGEPTRRRRWATFRSGGPPGVGTRDVIWVNFPETIFYHGEQATRATPPICSAPARRPAGGGATEMGLFRRADATTDRAFQVAIRPCWRRSTKSALSHPRPERRRAAGALGGRPAAPG